MHAAYVFFPLHPAKIETSASLSQYTFMKYLLMSSAAFRPKYPF